MNPYLVGFLGTLALTAVGVAMGAITPTWPFIGSMWIYMQAIAFWGLMVLLIARLFELSRHARDIGKPLLRIFWILVPILFFPAMYFTPGARGVFPLYLGLTVLAVGVANLLIFRRESDWDGAWKGVGLFVLGLALVGMGVGDYMAPIG